MAIKTYKRLGATVVVAITATELYAVPTSTQAIVSELTVCNIGTSERTYRIAVVDGAIGTVSNEDYKVYDAPISPNSSVIFNPGYAMEAESTILVYASHADVVFSCSGIEIS
jgi:hypothetical protein